MAWERVDVDGTVRLIFGLFRPHPDGHEGDLVGRIVSGGLAR